MRKNMFLLPIGTIVKLKKNEEEIMIVGYFVAKKNKIGLYAGVIYPQGIIDFDDYIIFNNSDLDKVKFEGYKDANYFSFEEAARKMRDLLVKGEKNNE